MNKNYTLLSIVILAIFSLLLSSEKVLATVGGPTYISQIAYNASNNSVYYIENDHGGKGCPPIIHSVNVTNTRDVEVKTCDEVFQQFPSSSDESDGQNYMQFIADIYNNLSYLGSVSLEKNFIDVRARILSEHIENGETYWNEFQAVITQDNKEIAKLNFRGCAKDQPNVFEGYRIPDTDSMAILISNKGDCFEGGYVHESLSIIKGIKYYDTNIIRSIKEASATEPNLGNRVVYATSDITENNRSDNDSDGAADPQKNPFVNTVLMIATFAIGLILGYVVGKKFSHFIHNDFSNQSN